MTEDDTGAAAPLPTVCPRCGADFEHLHPVHAADELDCDVCWQTVADLIGGRWVSRVMEDRAA